MGSVPEQYATVLTNWRRRPMWKLVDRVRIPAVTTIRTIATITPPRMAQEHWKLRRQRIQRKFDLGDASVGRQLRGFPMPVWRKSNEGRILAFPDLRFLSKNCKTGYSVPRIWRLMVASLILESSAKRMNGLAENDRQQYCPPRRAETIRLASYPRSRVGHDAEVLVVGLHDNVARSEVDLVRSLVPATTRKRSANEHCRRS